MSGFSIGGMFNNVIPAAQNSYGVMQQLNAAAQQAQAKQALGKLLQQVMAQGQPQAGAQPAGQYGPQLPGATPMPSAVSPTMAGAPAAAGGAPGGAGPMPSVSPGGGGAPSLFGIDPAVVQAMQQMKGVSPGAMGYLIGDVAGLSKPANANATRLEIAGQSEQGRNSRAQLSASTRMQIANQTAAYRRTAAQSAPKLKDDPEFRSLEDELNGAKTLYNASPTDDNLQAYHDAAKALGDYAKGKGSAASAGSKPTASAAHPAGSDSVPSYSQEDLEYTAKQNNMTVDEVKKKLGVQ